MAEPEEERDFWDAATSAFLRRRLHHRRMRAAAVRGLKMIEAGAGEGLELHFDDAAEFFRHASDWMAAHARELSETPAPTATERVPRLSIVILVVGSRGDVQPFLPIGRRLAWRHRVRLATHAEFRPMVEDAGLEFYPLAGDPRELMQYMVRTGGRIVPTRLDQIVEDVPKKRAVMAEILTSTWRACTRPDPEHRDRPFKADAIIANPPSLGHIHCAEALHVPLHMIFTMPWSPTSAFPHPLARIPPGEHRAAKNYLSYGISGLLIWSGLGDLINDFREQTLALPPVPAGDGYALLDDHEVPFTYLWPPSLVPKPDDWGPHIDLANFVFYDQGQNYRPPPELSAFLAAGEAPIYVGFGSCVVEDPEAVTRIIFGALEKAGVRGIVSQGWGRLGSGEVPPHVHLIGDCPHDWLFPRCRAVCHHGGAGTTAAGLRAGLPSVVVPFFGDQFFWGHVVAEAGAGPAPIPIDELDVDRLAAAFAACADEGMRNRAYAVGARIRETDGVELVAQSLYRHLPVRAMRCSRSPEHLATIYCDRCAQRVCQVCADAYHAGHDVHPYRCVDWGAHPEHGLAKELRSLVADAAGALRAGLDELTPRGHARRGGVVFADEPAPHEDPDRPLRKLRRWLVGD